jgi:hypothetical protein
MLPTTSTKLLHAVLGMLESKWKFLSILNMNWLSVLSVKGYDKFHYFAV